MKKIVFVVIIVLAIVLLMACAAPGNSNGVKFRTPTATCAPGDSDCWPPIVVTEWLCANAQGTPIPCH